MKKILVIAAAMMVAVAAQAQIVSSSSRSTISTPVERNGFSFIKGGISINNITGDDAGSWDSSTGYEVVIGAVSPMATVDGLYLGYEVGVGTRGAKGSLGGATLELRHTNVKFVPQVGFLLDLTPEITVDVHVGAALSYDFMGKAKASYDGASDSVKMKDYEDTLGWKVNRFDVGIQPGVSVWYGNFGLDFTYQRGLLGLVKEDGENYDVFTDNIQIRLAYRF